ncbi:MAG: alanine racemase [Planctomycetota bacterium]|jgi:alanine racemase
MSDTSRIRVDLSAVEHNVRVLRDMVGPDCVLCPIVKADGYGLGAAPIARHLKAAGAEMLAVYTPSQAAALAKAAVGGSVLVLAAVRELDRVDEAYRLLIRGDLHLAVHDGEHLEALVRLAERYATLIPVHLEIDTGMGRGGCLPGEAQAIARRIDEHRWLHLAGISTHFAKAGSDARATSRQLSVFDSAVRKCRLSMPEDCIIHAANTMATIRHHRYHKTMVRVGQGWAGYGTGIIGEGEFRREAAGLRPIVTWKSQIVQVKTIEKGAHVGYGSVWTARRRSRIGLVPVGYADGYPLGAGATDAEPKPACVRVETPRGSSKGEAGRFAPVVGKVNMDQITIDLTDIAPPGLKRCEIAPGTAVELIGTDPDAPNHLPTLAAMAGTISHEMLCRLNPRIKRIYHATERYEMDTIGAR